MANLEQLSILDLINIKYPGITGVGYQTTDNDGNSWSDPYDGLVWYNVSITKPSKTDIDNWRLDPELESIYTFKKNAQVNAAILAQLDALDIKSIRSLREPGDASTTKLNEIKQQAAALRAKLLPTA